MEFIDSMNEIIPNYEYRKYYLPDILQPIQYNLIINMNDGKNTTKINLL